MISEIIVEGKCVGDFRKVTVFNADGSKGIHNHVSHNDLLVLVTVDESFLIVRECSEDESRFYYPIANVCNMQQKLGEEGLTLRVTMRKM